MGNEPRSISIMNNNEISLFTILLVLSVVVINHIVVGIIRAEIRTKHIEKYRYDYYDQLSKKVNDRLLYNFKKVLFKVKTITISTVLSAITLYLLFFN